MSRPLPPGPFRAALPALVALLTLAACRESPPPRAAAVSPDGSIDLRLASFNIRYEGTQDRGWKSWPNRIDRVVRTIRQLDPDILGIQEALHGQAADLRASLTDFDFHGIGRDDGKRAGEYSAILWKRHRFVPAERGTFWLSDFPEQPGSRTWGNEVVRITSWIRLTDRSSARSILVLNTHWDHRNQPSRVRSATLIANRIDQLARPGEPVVLLGDMNATEGNPAVDYLAGRGDKPWPNSLTDPYAALHPREKNRRTLHFWEASPEGWAKVDHILVSRGASFQDAGILRASSRESEPSDHFPVWAHVRFPPP